RLRQGYDAFQHATAASRHRELVPDRLVDLMALAGPPDEGREQVRRVMTVPEIGRIIILPQVPDAGFIGRDSILRTFAAQGLARVCHSDEKGPCAEVRPPRLPCHVTRETIGSTNFRLRGPDMAPHSPYASTPRVRPSGAASHLDPSHRPRRHFFDSLPAA